MLLNPGVEFVRKKAILYKYSLGGGFGEYFDCVHACFAHTSYSAKLCHSTAQMERGSIDFIVREQRTHYLTELN